MEFLAEYGMFLAKVITLVIAGLALSSGIFAMIRANKGDSSLTSSLQVRHLNADYDRAAMAIKSVMLPRKAFKAERKQLKSRIKSRGKEDSRSKVFVMDFQGDIRASGVAGLREEITALLTIAGPGDEAVLRLESPGGQVPAYGLAAAQLLRIKDRDIRLTVAVDKMAASGGYMMACVADRITAAPFAILGSIGVVAQLPNFNRLLKKKEIDYEQFMAGEHKRTVTLFGENTDSDRQKFQEEIEEVHTLFKDFVGTHRPQLDLKAVGTGEYWYGSRALEHKLADELVTSDDYLLRASAESDLYLLKHTGKKPWFSRLLSQATQVLSGGR